MQPHYDLQTDSLHENFHCAEEIPKLEPGGVGTGLEHFVLKVVSPVEGTATMLKYFDEPILILPYYVLGVGATARHLFGRGKYIYISRGEDFFVGIRIQGKDWDRRKEEGAVVSGWVSSFDYAVSYFMLVSERRLFNVPERTLRPNPGYYKQTVLLGYLSGEDVLSCSTEEVKHSQGFLLQVGHDARRGMAGGPLVTYDKDGEGEVTALLITGCWLPSKVVVEMIHTRLGTHLFLSRDEISYLIDYSYVKVLGDCANQQERSVILNTWRAIMNEFRSLDKDEYKTLFYPVLQYLLYKEWKALYELYPGRFNYQICHRLVDSVSAVVDNIRVEEVEESRLETAFQIKRSHELALGIVRQIHTKFKDYEKYLEEELVLEQTRKHVVRLVVDTRGDLFRVFCCKESRTAASLMECFKEAWDKVILASLPTDLNEVTIQVEDPERLTLDSRAGSEALRWLLHQVYDYCKLKPALEYLHCDH